MKVCIIGNGIVSLTLANVLIQKELNVDILSNKKNNLIDKSRTLGISKSNIEYFNSEIINIKKILWRINRIKIYSEKDPTKEILEFNDNSKQIFSIVKNYELQNLLINKLRKSKFVKFKSNMNYSDIIKQQYKLIVNCDFNHQVTKKFFSNKIEKNYDSYAYTTTIYHKKIANNNTAFQNFTNNGPIAFLPISETQTSVVYSLRCIEKKSSRDMKNLIKKYNPFYSIIKINDCSRFELKSSYLRAFSPSAENKKKLRSKGFKLTHNNFEGVTIMKIESVGNYAMRIFFDDGHNTGIYSWEYLFKIGSKSQD